MKIQSTRIPRHFWLQCPGLNQVPEKTQGFPAAMSPPLLNRRLDASFRAGARWLKTDVKTKIFSFIKPVTAAGFDAGKSRETSIATHDSRMPGV
jgi:hypothetical protein